MATAGSHHLSPVSVSVTETLLPSWGHSGKAATVILLIPYTALPGRDKLTRGVTAQELSIPWSSQNPEHAQLTVSPGLQTQPSSLRSSGPV